MKMLEGKPYHLNADGVKKVEALYNAKFMGCWSTKKPRGGWNDIPVDVFYQPNADKSKGHSDYFGIFLKEDGGLYICDAASAFSEPMDGILCSDGQVLVSRWVHDYRCHGGYFIDGGRYYTRMGGNSLPKDNEMVKVTVKDGEFVFTTK